MGFSQPVSYYMKRLITIRLDYFIYSPLNLSDESISSTKTCWLDFLIGPGQYYLDAIT